MLRTLSVLLSLFLPIFANALEYDATYGVGGRSYVDLGSEGACVDAVHHEDGSMVLAFRKDEGVALAKLDPNGLLASGFGTAGILEDGSLAGLITIGITERASGGYAVLTHGTMSNGQGGPVLVGVTADGQIDEGFGSAGLMNEAPPGIASDQPLFYWFNPDTIVSDSGGIRVAVEEPRIGREHYLVLGYTDTGAFDSSFGEDGVCTIVQPDISGVNMDIHALVADGNGGYLLVATTQYFYALMARVRADGVLDTEFGSNGDGMEVWQWPEEASSTVRTVVVDDDICYAIGAVVSGPVLSPRGEIWVRALDRKGRTIDSYGNDGFASMPFTGQDVGRGVTPGAAVIDPTGRLLVAGYFQYNQENNQAGASVPAIVAFDPDGAIADGFGTGGRWQADPKHKLFIANTIVVHESGLRLACMGTRDGAGVALLNEADPALRSIRLELQQPTGALMETTVRRVQIGASPDSSEQILGDNGTHAAPFTAARNLDQIFTFVLPPAAGG